PPRPRPTLSPYTTLFRSFLIIGLADTTGKMTNFDLGNLIASQLQDPISRVDGVGDYLLFGSPYAMRIWLDPAKLNSYQLMPGDRSEEHTSELQSRENLVC